MAKTVRIEMTREQAEAVMRATELMARLHIGQFGEISWEFLSQFDRDGYFDTARRDKANELLEQASKTVFGTNAHSQPDIRKKDLTFERCWAVYTTIRYALAWHDHPEGGITVNFDRPLGYGERMPKCEVEDISDDGP